MDRLLIKGAHVVTQGKNLGVTDVIVEGDKIVSVGTSPVGAVRRNAPKGC